MIAIPTSPTAHLPFDLLAWASGSLLGIALYRWRLREATLRLAQRLGRGYWLALAIGVAVGAWFFGSLNTLQDADPALSHTIAGALVGGIVAVELYKLKAGISGSTGGGFVGPIALGIVIGRWGCLFAGLSDRTYGMPTSLPWAVDLGDGVGRHPVQLYESLAMLGFLLCYLAGLAQRSEWALRRAFYALALWYGLQRFAWEFLKPYPAVAGPLNLFHLLALGLVFYGGFLLLADRRRAARERALSLLGSDDEPLRDLPRSRPG